MHSGIVTEQEKVIFQPGIGGYREYRIPGILAMPDGALLLACEARAENKGDWGDIDAMVWRLERNGKMRQTVKIGQSHLPADGSMRTHNNPVLIPDGESVHLIYHKNYEQAFICSSSDQGQTWGAPREITEAYRAFPYEWNVCATGPGHGIQMKNGRLVAAIWLANGELAADGVTRKHWPSVAGCIYSDDHGLTWHAGALAPSMVNGNETTVAQLPDGRLLFNYRNMNTPSNRVLGISENGEKIDALWSSDQLEDPMCFGSMAATEQGVLFANCASATKRINALVKYSKDAGSTWQPLWHVDDVAGYIDIAYAHRRIYALYERSSYEKHIVEAIVLKVSEEIAL